MTANTSNNPNQTSLFAKSYSSSIEIKKASAEYDSFTRTRLSKHFFLKEFLHSSDSDFRGIPNIPRDKDAVVKAGIAICENVLELITQRYGKPLITYGYQSIDGIIANLSPAERLKKSRSISPHCWDADPLRQSVICRVDILPICVEDGKVSKREFGEFIMHQMDVDLLMTFKRSSAFCITYSESSRRRVWVEWGRPSLGEVQREVIMGEDYWQRIYPNLPDHKRPKFGPSDTGGSIRWSGK